MRRTPFLPKLFDSVLALMTLVGTAGLASYWLMARLPVADWRYLAVGILLAAVLGWWPWISLVAAALVAAGAVWIGASWDQGLKIQVVEEIAVFWALGLGWGALAHRWFAAPAAVRSGTATGRAPTGPAIRSAPEEAFRSTRLLSGGLDESVRKPLAPSVPVSASGAPFAPPAKAPAVASPAPSDELGPRGFPVFQEPPRSGGPLPRPVLPPPPSYFGGELVYTPSLPGLVHDDSSHVALDEATPPPPPPPPALGMMATPPRHPAIPAHLDVPSAVRPFPDEPSVVPAEEFPTMELPVNTLLRATPSPAPLPSPAAGASSGSGSSAGSSGDGSDADNHPGRRVAGTSRPETEIGTSHEHLLEWFNQFSWSPWTAEELRRRYFLPGTHVGWESRALADLAKVWKIWKAGPVPVPTSPGQVSLVALEGFLRCEVLGVLRQKGHPDLHRLSVSTAGEAWTAVYHEVRGRLRGGSAEIHRVDQGEPASDANDILVGRPDRLAEVRKESDVVALVTPFARDESLSWTGVYAVAQQRIAENMGWVLSGVPVAVHLPLPVWDERRLSRVVVVEDVVTELRRLDVALERFNRILSGLLPAKPQTQAAVCNGCGGRHHCPQYGGTRSRLDLSAPPPQLATALS